MISLELLRGDERGRASLAALCRARAKRVPDDCVLLLEHTAGRARKLSSFGGTQALVGAHLPGHRKSQATGRVDDRDLLMQQLGAIVSRW
jgi:hypothetical protein